MRWGKSSNRTKKKIMFSKIDTFGYIAIKNLLPKLRIKKAKTQEKIFSTHRTEQVFVLRIYKEIF